MKHRDRDFRGTIISATPISAEHKLRNTTAQRKGLLDTLPSFREVIKVPLSESGYSIAILGSALASWGNREGYQ